MKTFIILIAILIISSCTTELNNFGGYHDPRYFENIGIIKNPLGKNIMTNIEDKQISLFFENNLPKIFILGYYRCPQMCNSFRDSLFPVLASSNLKIGTDYEIIMTSINPKESIEEATIDGDKYLVGVATDYAGEYPNAPYVWKQNKLNQIEEIGNSNIEKYSLNFELRK